MRKTSESGQSLLIIVLMISVVFTIIATASYRLTTESQSTRLQEESIKTLAAADSGIERGVQFANDNAETVGGPVTFASLGINTPGVNATASTLEVTAELENSFLSPQIPKDEQYTFYLHKFPDRADSLNQDVFVHFANTTNPVCNAAVPAVEISLLYGTNGQRIERWIGDPCNLITSTSGELPFTSNNYVFDGINLRYRVRVPVSTTASAANPAQLLMVRTIGRETNLGFTITSGQLYSQGQTITSRAVSTTGVTKVVTLFKSYPQIPADFFVTRF